MWSIASHRGVFEETRHMAYGYNQPYQQKPRIEMGVFKDPVSLCESAFIFININSMHDMTLYFSI